MIEVETCLRPGPDTPEPDEPTPPGHASPATGPVGAAQTVQACGDQPGTHAGYQRHHRAGQTTCEPCRQARRDYLATPIQRRQAKRRRLRALEARRRDAR